MRASDLVIDRAHLTSKEYATDEGLEVRIRTHELYTRPKMDFPTWVLDQVPWRGDETVLDLGCGSGLYFEAILARLKRGGRLLGADLSMGMLQDVRSGQLLALVDLINTDAMHLPLPENSCDLLLANHMLYHVPQIEQAASEMRRVLRPGGFLLATTNARHSMRGFIDVLETAALALGYPMEIPVSPVMERFNLENGCALLGPVFPGVQVHRIESALVFPSTDPAIAYLDSMRHTYSSLLPDGLNWDDLLRQVRQNIQAIMEETGNFRVSKATGFLRAHRSGRIG